MPSLKARALCLLAAAALVPPIAGCDIEANDGRTASLTHTEDARAAYQEAMAAYVAKDWEDAKALFAEVKRLFAYTRYAKLAELRLADVDFEQEKYTDAIAGYRDFVQNHRADRDVEYAKYRITKALFLDIDDTLFLPPHEERDQATAREAHRELKAFMKEFPRSRYFRDVAYMLEVVTSRLVRHDLYVARYYVRQDVFPAAVARCDHALKAYPNSGLEAETLVLKGETLLKMQKREEARKVFETVLRDYPGPFAVTARAFLREMGVEAPAAPRSSLPRSSPARLHAVR